MNEKRNNKIKFWLDFIPAILFFASYKLSPSNFKPAVFAALVLTISTIISFCISRALKIKLSKLSMYSNFGVVIFGAMTVIFNEPIFIKIKLTVINLAFSCVLGYFYFTKRPLVKAIFGDKVDMKDQFWLIITKKLSFLFFAIAIANEIIWRSLPEEMWINFKVFCVPLIMILFFILQMRFIVKNGTIKHN